MTRAQVEFTRDLRWDEVPPAVRERMRRCCDHVAVCEAGRTAPASLIAAEYASEVHAGDRATALVDGRRLSAPGAAWANGVLANVLDYDDGHRITKGHPGAMVIPAALATAEAVDASATAFLAAVLVGYEVALRAGVADPRARGAVPRVGVVGRARRGGEPRGGCSVSAATSCATRSASPSTTRRSR